MKIVHLILFLFLSGSYCDNTALTLSSENEENNSDPSEVYMENNFISNSEEFVANEDWQEVKEGQAIPAGLHIRLNLQTGVREAKLLDNYDNRATSKEDFSKLAKIDQMKSALEEAIQELQTKKSDDDSNIEYWNEHGKEGMKKSNENTFTKKELKSALKKFKLTKDDRRTGDKENNQETNIKSKFKSMEELKSDFKKLKMDMKTDIEILQSIYRRYTNNIKNDEEKIDLLNELEYLLHQIDNANNFVDMGGVEMLIKDLNSTSIELKNILLLVLAAAVQSNSHAQVAYMEAGILQKLLQIIANEKNTITKQRALTCLSALLRGFPYAQHRFLEFGGLNILMEFLKTPEIFGEKLAIKSISLLHDLIQEQISLKDETIIGEELLLLKMDQYRRIPILQKTEQHGLCGVLPKFLISADHDIVEKVANFMELVIAPCYNEFILYQDVISNAQDKYIELGLLEGAGTDGYFESIARGLERTIISLNKFKTKNMDTIKASRDEL